MYKIYFLLIVFCIACSNNQQSIEIKEIKNGNLHTIEKGVLINGKRDGYWITVEEDSRFIKIESYYKNDVLNGPIKLYTDDGLLMSEGYMKNDSTNGLWTYYYGNGKTRSRGLLENGNKTGIWEFYIENGLLDKKILYQHGSDTTLVDNHLSLPIPQPQ